MLLWYLLSNTAGCLLLFILGVLSLYAGYVSMHLVREEWCIWERLSKHLSATWAIKPLRHKVSKRQLLPGFTSAYFTESEEPFACTVRSTGWEGKTARKIRLKALHRNSSPLTGGHLDAPQESTVRELQPISLLVSQRRGVLKAGRLREATISSRIAVYLTRKCWTWEEPKSFGLQFVSFILWKFGWSLTT